MKQIKIKKYRIIYTMTKYSIFNYTNVSKIMFGNSKKEVENNFKNQHKNIFYYEIKEMK